MPDNKDIYGNVDRYSLFLDSRTDELVWYPTQYQSHPIWGQFLERQFVRIVDTRIYPSNMIFPGPSLFPGSILTYPLPDVARPPGMHGIGTQ